MPVAFAFLLVTFLGGLAFVGLSSPETYIRGMFSSLTNFTLIPVPLFILMGEVLFNCGIAAKIIDGVDQWLGSVPARMSLLAIAGGSLIAAISGASIGSTAILGSILYPEMRRRGYSNALSAGPILASGSLDMLIPPSVLIVVYASATRTPLGPLLMAGFIPGIIMAIMYAGYIVFAVRMRPDLAPMYVTRKVPLIQKMKLSAVEILPALFLIFMVSGLIVIGVATPTESAATGVVGTLILALWYRKLTVVLLLKSVLNTMRVASMILIIVASSAVFSQMVSFTGSAQGLVSSILESQLSPATILIIIFGILLVLGALMDATAIILIAGPLFMPICLELGIDPIVFGILFLIAIQIGLISPPYGILLFTFKGVAPGIPMKDIWWSVIPFIVCDLIAVFVMYFFPQIVLYLPSIMKS